MRGVLCLLIGLGISVLGASQVGVLFPVLEGEILSGGQITLPNDTDRPTIIGMAYSKKAEADLKTWYQPMYDTFVLKRGIFDSMYKVDLFMIPMFTGMKKAAYESSIKKLREENRKDLFPHIVFYRGSLEPYATELKMDDKNKPYLFIIDQNGRVLFSTSGAYTAKKKESIENVLDPLMD